MYQILLVSYFSCGDPLPRRDGLGQQTEYLSSTCFAFIHEFLVSLQNVETNDGGGSAIT